MTDRFIRFFNTKARPVMMGYGIGVSIVAPAYGVTIVALCLASRWLEAAEHRYLAEQRRQHRRPPHTAPKPFR